MLPLVRHFLVMPRIRIDSSGLLEVRSSAAGTALALGTDSRHLVVDPTAGAFTLQVQEMYADPVRYQFPFEAVLEIRTVYHNLIPSWFARVLIDSYRVVLEMADGSDLDLFAFSGNARLHDGWITTDETSTHLSAPRRECLAFAALLRTYLNPVGRL